MGVVHGGFVMVSASDAVEMAGTRAGAFVRAHARARVRAAALGRMGCAAPPGQAARAAKSAPERARERRRGDGVGGVGVAARGHVAV